MISSSRKLSSRIFVWMIIFSLAVTVFCNESDTSSSTKKVRVRRREFLRGGDQPATKAGSETTTTSTSTTTKGSTIDKKQIDSFMETLKKLQDDDPKPDPPRERKTESTTKVQESSTVSQGQAEKDSDNVQKQQDDWLSGEWKTPTSVDPVSAHTSTLIFLHGAGDKGSNWTTFLTHVRKPSMKIICPNAKNMPICYNNKTTTTKTSWFDYVSESDENRADLNRSSAYIHKLIDDEIKHGVKSNRIFIGGYLQGGAMAIYSALTYPHKLGGLITIHGWVPIVGKIFEYHNGINADIPIFQSHGEKDESPGFRTGPFTHSVLVQLTRNYTFKEYDTEPHLVNDQGKKDLKEYFNKYIKEA